MKPLSPLSFSFFAVSVLLVSSAPSALGANDSDQREVRIAFVQDDVRLSRGDGKRPDLNRSWEQAQAGELVEQGSALSTGNGRAEIAFENGSTVYLAENSLLLFRAVSAPRDRIVTGMTLATGSATFMLQPASNEYFSIQTPTDNMQIPSPEVFFARVDAYLDSTAITAQAEKGESMVREGLPNFQIEKGRTVFFRGGEIITPPAGDQTELSADARGFVSASLREIEANSRTLRASALLLPVPGGPILQNLPNFKVVPEMISLLQENKLAQRSGTVAPGVASDWDNWVSARVQQKGAVIASALKASGLSTPIPGLEEMYEYGDFFNCGAYGTCWEPSEHGLEMDPAPQSAVPGAQSPSAAQSNGGFQPQTVQWREVQGAWCGLGTWGTVTRVAHTPEELQVILAQKAAAESANSRGLPYSMNCYNGYWIHNRGHYARVIKPRTPPHCAAGKCKPVHPPRPLYVKVGKQMALVPRHPNDVKGKPPINLKNGIIVPPIKVGQTAQLVTVDASQKVQILAREPKGFQNMAASRAPAATAPEIHAHLLPGATQEIAKAAIPQNPQSSQIHYDYKSQKFVTAGAVVPGTKSKEVAVGGIASNGKVASFADGHSSHYAGSFAHSSAAATYAGAARSTGSSSTYSSGGHGSGGGHSSGSYSAASASSGSHSSSSGSSSGGSSSGHSSGGGGGGGSSSAISSSAGSAGGGHSH